MRLPRVEQLVALAQVHGSQPRVLRGARHRPVPAHRPPAARSRAEEHRLLRGDPLGHDRQPAPAERPCKRSHERRIAWRSSITRSRRHTTRAGSPASRSGARAGHIVYSNDHQAIGKKFEVEDDLAEAFGGKTHSAHLDTARPRSRRASGSSASCSRHTCRCASPPGAAAGRRVRDLRSVRPRGGGRPRMTCAVVYALVAGGLTLLFLLLYRIVARASQLAAPPGRGEPLPGPARPAHRATEPALPLRADG